MKKRVLCYGDSNTWGYIAGKGERYPEDVRWTGILQSLLGDSYTVIEEAQNGRTTVWDDPIECRLSGLTYFYPCIESQSPLDLIIIAVMTSSLGKGCAFSALPVLLLEGGVTLLARLVSPLMTETAVAYLSLIGSVLIFCVGLNLVWGKKIRVANLLPAVFLAVAAAFLPLQF